MRKSGLKGRTSFTVCHLAPSYRQPMVTPPFRPCPISLCPASRLASLSRLCASPFSLAHPPKDSPSRPARLHSWEASFASSASRGELPVENAFSQSGSSPVKSCLSQTPGSTVPQPDHAEVKDRRVGEKTRPKRRGSRKTVASFHNLPPR